MFNADLALSVAMTAMSTVVSIIALPFHLLVWTRLSYGNGVARNLDWTALVFSLMVVLSAISMGLFASKKLRCDHFRKLANMLGNASGVALLVFSATVTNSGEDVDSKIWARDWRFYIATLLPCALGLFVANLIASCRDLPDPERV